MGSSPLQHMSWQGTGMRTVVSGGTPNALVTATTYAKRVMVKAKSGNGGSAWVGLSTMTKDYVAANLTTGWELAAGEETPWLLVPDDDLLNVFIDGTTNDDVMFIYDG